MLNKPFWVELQLVGILVIAGINPAAKGQEVKTLNCDFKVFAVTFSPDGNVLATAGGETNESGQAVLWDVATGKQLISVAGHTSHATCAAFSPDSKTLATGAWDGTVKLWDAATGKRLADLDHDLRLVASLAYSPDGKTLASGAFDLNFARPAEVKLWNMATKNAVTTLKGTNWPIYSLAFTSDGKSLVASNHTVVIKWDAATREEQARLKLECYASALHRDAKTFAVVSARAVKLWEINTDKEVASLSTEPDNRSCLAFGSAADGKVLACGQSTGTVRLWGSRKRQASIKAHASAVYSVSLSPDAKTLATGSEDKTVKLWNVANLLNK